MWIGGIYVLSVLIWTFLSLFIIGLGSFSIQLLSLPGSVRQCCTCGDYDFLPSLIYIFDTGCWLVFLFCFQAGLDGWEERSHHSHLWLIINLAPVKACSLLGSWVG